MQESENSWIDTRVSSRRRRRNTRCCSFCREDTHTVNLCNSPRLTEFENILYEKKMSLLALENVDVNHKMRDFELWLCTMDNVNILKAYAVNKCGAYTRDSLSKCILFITRKIWIEERQEIHEYILQRQQEYYNVRRIQNEFIRLRTTFSQIADQINQVNQNNQNNEPLQEAVLEGVMSWIIDRTPDLTILERMVSPPKKLEIVWKYEKENEQNKINNEECSICYEQTEYSNKVKLNCNHDFCGFCVKKIIEKNNKPCCAFCRVTIEKIEVNSMNMECMFDDYKK
jgi:hypothetical protein